MLPLPYFFLSSTSKVVSIKFTASTIPSEYCLCGIILNGSSNCIPDIIFVIEIEYRQKMSNKIRYRGGKKIRTSCLKETA